MHMNVENLATKPIIQNLVIKEYINILSQFIIPPFYVCYLYFTNWSLHKKIYGSLSLSQDKTALLTDYSRTIAKHGENKKNLHKRNSYNICSVYTKTM